MSERNSENERKKINAINDFVEQNVNICILNANDTKTKQKKRQICITMKHVTDKVDAVLVDNIVHLKLETKINIDVLISFTFIHIQKFIILLFSASSKSDKINTHFIDRHVSERHKRRRTRR